MSCPYKYALGIPEKGVHALRFMGYAVNDTLMTIAGAALLAWIFNTPFLITFVCFFVLGELLHVIFGVQTAVLTTLGIKSCS
jgi:hypothetical protein